MSKPAFLARPYPHIIVLPTHLLTTLILPRLEHSNAVNRNAKHLHIKQRTNNRAAVFSATEFEQQSLTCTLDAVFDVTSAAAFSISFRQGTTDPMTAGSSTLSDLEAALESLSTIGDVEVQEGHDAKHEE